MTAQPKFPLSPYHTALRCLFVVALQRGVRIKPEQLSVFNKADTLASVLSLIRTVGLHGRLLNGCKWKQLTGLATNFPLMALLEDGNWVVVVNVVLKGPATGSVILLDPRAEQSGPIMMSNADFLEHWSGTLVLCNGKTPGEADQPFDLRWFLPEVFRHKRYLKDVAIAAILSSIIAYSMPLMFQILLDKVVSHRSYQTLFTIMLVFVTLTIFDGVFNYTRQYLMLMITSKIDAQLAARTFRKLLQLPMSFFESTTAGVLTKNMLQTETIRNFLTGRVFQTALDSLTLPVTVVILFLYSAKLAAIVLGFSALIALIIGLMLPLFRRNLEQLYVAEGARQGHLVETIHGMRTVKSLAVEPARLDEWNGKVALGVRRRTAVGRVSALAGVVTQSLDKLMQITILGLGAVDVFNNVLTVGALVAFNMVAGRVTGPLVQIVGLITEYQETSLAIRMLGGVMRQPSERNSDQTGLRPTITGELEFVNVTFRYPNAGTTALKNVSFQIGEGQVIGVVGRSGSGKTTITRLIQGIQTAQEGEIKLNGVDIRHIDLEHLRRSTGVVLQENFLFRGTLRSNIAAACPESGLEDIMAVARLAGADEFISRLPLSYDTFVEESGANFSGGQRQRIAIARALLTQPKLFIFDEATSALDPESEAVIQAHLNEIASGRTLIIVSHRLTSLAHADAILVLEQGAVVDFAPHRVLLERCEVYKRLWSQQTHRLRP